MVDHILKSCGIGALDTPTIIFEDNVVVLYKWSQDISRVT
jgi:hypothetical protein